MGKHGKYIKHYRDEWEKMPIFKNWLSRASEDLIMSCKGEAYCKLCRTPLRAHKTDLEKHAKRKTHIEKENAIDTKKQPKLTSFAGVKTNEKEKCMDIKLAVHTAYHSSVRSIDHLGEMLKELGQGSPLENLRLHRTKCSNIILNILEPTFREELLTEIGDEPYSIVLDESTDVGNDKYMAYVVRYYKKKRRCIATDFLGFQAVHRATAAELCAAFKDFLKEVGLKFQNLIAIGTDGASNLCGKNNSLYTHLKAELPHLQILKCVCHSLSLCAAKACEELPSSLEYLLRETRNWFSHSSLRTKTYQQVYQTINDGKSPPKLVQLAATRWLSFHSAVEVNVKQWIPLKTHFNNVANSNEKCYQARELQRMYNDDAHMLYLVFLGPLLKEVTDMNLIFQADSANITKIYKDLRVLLSSLTRRVFKPASLNAYREGSVIQQEMENVKAALSKSTAEFENSVLDLNSIDFGHTFSVAAQRSSLPPSKITEIKQRCAKVMIRLCEEFVNRFPGNLEIIQGLECFDPGRALQHGPLQTNMMPWVLAPPGIDRDSIETQLRHLKTLSSKDIPGYDEEDLSPEKFWVCVSDMTNAAGQKVFKDLSQFALRALSLPISNATVERVFSVMNTVKTKLRKKMQLPMLQAIIRTRLYLGVRKICCQNFTPTANMIKRHNFHDLYPKQAAAAAAAAARDPGPSTSRPNTENEDDNGGILEQMILLADDLD